MGGLILTPSQQRTIGRLTRCLDCDNNEYTFFFNRLLAARTALYLSSQNPASIASAGDGTHSATFMSICYYAGGIPMIGTAGIESIYNGWTAWYKNGRINGSGIWDNHSIGANGLPANSVGGNTARPAANSSTFQADLQAAWTDLDISTVQGFRLIHFLTNPTGLYPSSSSVNNRNIPEDSIIEWNNTRSVLAVRWWMFIGPGSVLYTDYFDPAVHSDFQFHRDYLNKIRSFLAGDYVWYPIDGNAHGLLIVGYGPAIDWGEYAEAKLSSRSDEVELCILGMNSRRGFQFGLDDPSGLVTDYTARFGVTDVPYVCDWRTDANNREIFQGPRPFYATRLLVNNANLQAQHPYWVFIPAPSSGKVVCNLVYAANCFDDAQIDVGIDGVPREVTP